MSLDVPLLAGVSDNDKRRWQIAANRALAEILKRADRQKLKPIEWRLPGGLQVVGYIHSLDYGNVGKAVVDAFQGWCDLLTLTPDHLLDKSGGGLYLAGRHDNWRPKPNQTGAKVAVIAQTFSL